MPEFWQGEKSSPLANGLTQDFEQILLPKFPVRKMLEVYGSSIHIIGGGLIPLARSWPRVA
jgi:hypothetical protein